MSPIRPIVPFAMCVALVAACSSTSNESPDPPEGGSAAGPTTRVEPDHDHGGPETAAGATQVRRPAARLAYTYDGGVQVLDSTTLQPVADFPGKGYLRVNPAGDQRHVFLSESNHFSLIDLGAWSEDHGDHKHYYSSTPKRTEVTVDAPETGHVVVHDGRTVLFSDGTGAVTSVPSKEVADREAIRTVYQTPRAHHGVAVPRADGSLLVSVGDEKTRTGAAILSADRTVLAQTDQCPGLHGEAAAARGVVVFGCEDGVIRIRGNEITKFSAPTAGYARTGTIAGTEAHPVVLGDYKAAKSEHPTRVSLVNTETGDFKLVDLPASYSFRSLARGLYGEALVLGTDGVVRVIDPDTGVTIREVRATAPWTEDADWQVARPTIYAQGSTAYITDPVTKTIVAYDIESGRELRRATTAHAVDEVTGVSGVSAS